MISHSEVSSDEGHLTYIKVCWRPVLYKKAMNRLLKAALLRNDRMVPRYTSYPTAPHFQAGLLQGWYAERLTAIPDNSSISLYVHVPFCPKLCWFCGCHTRVTNSYAAVDAYVDLLLAELKMLAPFLANRGIKISHLHFGGGSPTILKQGDFRNFVDAVQKYFSFMPGAEIAIEIDPRNIDADKIKAYAKAGVNRVSFGIQDFNQTVMEGVNRPQSYELDRDMIELCRAEGIHKINLDLMYGLPHQTAATMADCAELALTLDPDRIALFGYAHVPWLKKHMRLMDEDALPSAEKRLGLFEVAAEIFEEAGYIPIGIDHFAKPEDELTLASRTKALHRNFQGYTNDSATYLIGIGASAISNLGDTYAQNVAFLPQYRDRIKAGEFAIEKNCLLSDEDMLHAAVIKEMMCDLSVNPYKVAQSAGLPDYDFSSAYAQMQQLKKDKLIVIAEDGTIYALIRQAARLVSACFDTRLSQSTQRRHVSSA